jgi:hypothetical protein
MAARLNKPWRFYVYELIDKLGNVQYVGKGSTTRLAAQKRNFGLEGYEVARFAREADAYGYEVQRIATVKPPLNKHVGGNGSKAQKKVERKTNWQKQLEQIGSRAYAARLWLAFARSDNADLSKVDAIRSVAYG